MNCKICGNSEGNESFLIREMMFGLKEEFVYIQCAQCDCLQIEEIPINMHTYYPDNYYSYAKPQNNDGFLKNMLIKQRDLYVIEKRRHIVGRIINKLKPASDFIKTISETGINKQSKILDIGTGHGGRLLPLINAGFNVLGIEPYLGTEKTEINGLTILKKNIYQMEGKWDLIMLNHVFEHLEDPAKILSKINDLLSPNGKCLIRIPIIPSYAWEKYQENWVQIDAPRHFFIHSLKSLGLLAKSSALEIEKIIYDSIPFQFLGSELNKRGVSSKEGDFRLNSKNRSFSLKEISFFVNKTVEVNQSQNGDQAAFILRKIN